MSPSSYFQQLREELKNNPYRDRFLQELEDHAEDLSSEENISLSLKAIRKKLGEPTQVKKIFIGIVQPWQKFWEITEAFLIGFLATLIMRGSLVFTEGTFFGSSYLYLILSAAMGYTFYRLAYRFSLKQRQVLESRVWLVLVFSFQVVFDLPTSLTILFYPDFILGLSHLLWILFGVLAWFWPKKLLIALYEEK